MMTNDTPDPLPPSRLTAAQVAMVGNTTDSIMEQGQLPGMPQVEPRAVTPASIEVYMARFLDSSPEMRAACCFLRPADATVDAGEHDLTPLCNIVVQATRTGPQAQAITAMFAAWGIATYHRMQAGGAV